MAEIFNHYVRTSTVIFSNRQLTADDMRSKLESLGAGSEFPFLVSEEEDGGISGYCYAHRWQPDPVYDRTWELTMYLDNRCTGRGTGTALINAIIDLCREGGAHALVAAVTEGNAACERMCVRAGFRLVGLMPEVGYKFGQYLNDAIYQKIL